MTEDRPLGVIAAYRVRKGCEEEFNAVLREHRERWRAMGLVTDREWVWMRSYADPGLIIELFEWKSHAAVKAAHQHPDVLDLWDRMGKFCDVIGVPLCDWPEAQEQFPHFERFDP